MLYFTSQILTTPPFKKWPRELVEELCLRRQIGFQSGFEERVLLLNVMSGSLDGANRCVSPAGLTPQPSNRRGVFYQHDITQFVGYSLDEKINEAGILQSLVLFTPVEEKGKSDLFGLVANGIVKAASLCIHPKVTEESDNIVKIQEWNLVEISLCSLWHPSLDEDGQVVYNNFITKERIGKTEKLTYYIYADEAGHNVPHFHVYSKDKSTSASIRIDNGNVIVGTIRSNHKKELYLWYDQNRRSLLHTWEKLRPSE